MSESKRVPALRFKGFTDPWEQRKLGEIVVELSSGRSVNSTDEAADDEDVAILKTSCVSESRFNPNERKKVVADETNLVKCSVEARTLVVSRMNTPERVGACGFVADSVSNLYLPDRLWRVKVGSFADPFVVYISLISERNKARLKGAASGTSGSMHNIPKDAFLEMKFVLPINISEQTRIGNLFAKLDSLITLHQRKYDKLVVLKKSLLEKMFPKPDSKVPEIRFSGFTDPWEQRKFSDFVVASGVRNSENLPFQSYSVSNDRGFVPQDEQFEHGGTMREADKTAYWIVEPGSFAYNPARINVGSIGYLSTSENVIVSSLYEVFKTDSTCDDGYLWHWFKSPLFMKQIEMYQEGGVRLYYFFDKLCKSVIWMPSVEEQKSIGVVLDRLDSLITLHQRELDVLKNVKKSLLEKMFI